MLTLNKNNTWRTDQIISATRIWLNSSRNSGNDWHVVRTCSNVLHVRANGLLSRPDKSVNVTWMPSNSMSSEPLMNRTKIASFSGVSNPLIYRWRNPKHSLSASDCGNYWIHFVILVTDGFTHAYISVREFGVGKVSVRVWTISFQQSVT